MLYLMRAYTSGDQLWQTHPISASDDAAARSKAEILFAVMTAEQAALRESPRLERFRLWQGDQIV